MNIKTKLCQLACNHVTILLIWVLGLWEKLENWRGKLPKLYENKNRLLIIMRS